MKGNEGYKSEMLEAYTSFYYITEREAEREREYRQNARV